MEEEKELLSTLLLELRRGTLTISVLSQMKEPKYGYALVQSLEQKGVAIDPNTLYPLLRRLESHGLWKASGKPAVQNRESIISEQNTGSKFTNSSKPIGKIYLPV